MTRTDSTALSLRVLTVNTHKGFAAGNRRFVLSELREAVRAVGADVVFLQEVQGAHAGHAARVAGWPAAPHYEYLADELWPEFAYGRNAVYPDGDHGNAVLSRFPIVAFENRDVSVAGHQQGRVGRHVGADDLAQQLELVAAVRLLPVSYTHLRAHET